MTPDETRTLLGQIAAIDNRKMTPDTVRTWHTALQRHTLTDCLNALAQFRRNRPDDWVTPGHLTQAIDRNHRPEPRCPHGIATWAYCHDCTHPADCPMCQPQPRP
jgi:hypothetical protein